MAFAWGLALGVVLMAGDYLTLTSCASTMPGMTDALDSYEGVPFHRWQTDAIAHMRELHRRNELLQKRLDEAMADAAKAQRQLLESRPAPVQVVLSATPMDGDLNVDRHEDRLLAEAFRRSGGSKAIAAELLGVNRGTVYAMLERAAKRNRKARMAS